MPHMMASELKGENKDPEHNKQLHQETCAEKHIHANPFLHLFWTSSGYKTRNA